ncbi:MAG: DUF2911 domain-containing protein, partial [Lewinella sp.]|nr:DUF2911 domain-containing protein [Lewinella sp.]
MRLPILFVILLSQLFLISCGPSEIKLSTFITTLGKDTLAIEQFTMQPERIDAEVLIRSPRTTYQKQTLEMDETGAFQSFHSVSYDPKDPEGGKALEETTITVEGDSMIVTRSREGEEQVNKLAYNPGILPWQDMVHWPYEVATRHMVEAGKTSSDQLMLAGRSPAVFEIRTIEGDSVSIKHPYRGTMYARLDEYGAIQYYDATATTRKLIVQRSEPVDMTAVAKLYAEQPIGSLSGEGETKTTVHGASIVLTYGQPAKRGRDLFGGIVPWNERWRTGANRATHFSTDKDLIVNGLEVPAGEYTLFTIPTPAGGTLIINKQTGQNGQQYDESQDLGRVPMTIRQQDESVELFTIDAVEQGIKGALQLKWGNT